MKTLRTLILLTVLVFAGATSSNAQFNLKKLKDKANKVKLKTGKKGTQKTSLSSSSNNKTVTQNNNDNQSSNQSVSNDNNTDCKSARMYVGMLESMKEYADNQDFFMAEKEYESCERHWSSVESNCPDDVGMCKDEREKAFQYLKEKGFDLKAKYEGTELLAANKHKVQRFAGSYCHPVSTDFLTKKSQALKFETQAKELDYANLKLKIEKAGKNAPDIKEEYDYKTIVEMQDKFSKSVLHIFSEITLAMNKAKTSQAKGVSELRKAYIYAKAAQHTANGVLYVIPENAEAKSHKEKADKLVAEIGKDFEAKVFTSTFHKENAGKILFSTSPIRIKGEDASQFTTHFTPADKIYAMCYLNGSITDLFKNKSKVILGLKVLLDGNYLSTVNFTLYQPELQKTWLMTEIIPDAKTAIGLTDAIEWEKNILRQIPSGEHKLSIQLKQYDDIFAESTITVNWDNYNAEALKKNAENACKNADNNMANIRTLPKEFSEASSRFADPKMSTANIKKMILNNPEFNDVAQITKLSIGKAKQDWFINKNGSTIVGKFNARSVRLVFKGKDGWCYYIPNVTFNCKYLGNGRYGAPSAHIPSGSKVKIACKNVK